MRVAVLGCGYVGTELARRLVDGGHRATGVVRSREGADRVEATGARAVRADVTDADSLSAVPDADALVFAASAGRGSVADARRLYLDGLRNAIDEFSARGSPPSRLLLASSTGVYGDRDGDWVDSSTPVDPPGPKAEIVADAETLVREAGVDGTVVRFGGLYGPGRYRLRRYLEGPVTAGYRNSTHRDDAAGALKFLLEGDLARDETVLVVDGDPAEKRAFADWLADECGVDRPPKRTLDERPSDGDLSTAARRRLASRKRCRNDRLLGLEYELEAPSVYEGYRPAIEAFRRGEDPDAGTDRTES